VEVLRIDVQRGARGQGRIEVPAVIRLKLGLDNWKEGSRRLDSHFKEGVEETIYKSHYY
jgi:hypothetical protein